MPDTASQEGLDAFGSGHCHGRDNDRTVRPSLAQTVDQRCGGIDFTHRNGMNPDAPGWTFETGPAKAFANALSIPRAANPFEDQPQKNPGENQIQKQPVSNQHGFILRPILVDGENPDTTAPLRYPAGDASHSAMPLGAAVTSE